MRRGILVMALLAALVPAAAQNVKVASLQGDVSVRHGVAENWNTVAAGDVLKPDDTMKTGPKGSAVLVARGADDATKRITLPPDVLVDISDIRQLTPEELMLKLTMQKVRASSYQRKSDELQIPNATVVHGANRASGAPAPTNDPQTGSLFMNGARVLFENGFYSTCALRAMEIFRQYPAMAAHFDDRFMMALSLEKASLRGEALTEYSALLRMEGLTTEQRRRVEERVGRLRIED